MAKRKLPHEADEAEDPTPAATIEHPGLLPPLILGPPILPEGPPPDKPEPTPLVGVVHFENASGGDNGQAHYPVPVTLRERVLLWRHQRHEQNHQRENGEWVYRLSHDAGVGLVAQDADLEAIADEDA